MEQIHINFAKFDSLIQIADYFSSEEICKQAIAQEHWGDGEAVCPYCGSTHTHVCKEGRYICKNFQNKFSVTVGTIFENTKISLRKLFMAMYLISSHKRGASYQLARDIKVTQKTAWFMLHKVRGLYGQSDETVLNGTVEMDEMYLGGRETNKHESKKTEGTQGRSTKTPIFGMIERDGKVVAMKVETPRVLLFFLSWNSSWRKVQPPILMNCLRTMDCLRRATTTCLSAISSVSMLGLMIFTPMVLRAFGHTPIKISAILYMHRICYVCEGPKLYKRKNIRHTKTRT